MQRNCFHEKHTTESDYQNGVLMKSSGYPCPLPSSAAGHHSVELQNHRQDPIYELEVSVYTDGDLFIQGTTQVREHIFPGLIALDPQTPFNETCPIQSGSQNSSLRSMRTVIQLYSATQRNGPGSYTGFKQMTELSYEIWPCS